MSRNRGRNKKRKPGSVCKKYEDHTYMRMRMENQPCFWLYRKGGGGRILQNYQHLVILRNTNTSFCLCEHCIHRISDES